MIIRINKDSIIKYKVLILNSDQNCLMINYPRIFRFKKISNLKKIVEINKTILNNNRFFQEQGRFKKCKKINNIFLKDKV